MFLFTLFISKTCLEIFEKQSWQEIFHSERITPSLTAHKIIFSWEWLQSQGSDRVNVQWALLLLLLPRSILCSQAGWKGQDGLGAAPRFERALSSDPLQGGATGVYPYWGSPWKEGCANGATGLPLGSASQGTGLWHCRQTHSFLLSPPPGSLCGQTVLRQ